MDGGGYFFVVFLWFLPKLYPRPKQAMPKLRTAIKSIILISIPPYKVGGATIPPRRGSPLPLRSARIRCPQDIARPPTVMVALVLGTIFIITKICSRINVFIDEHRVTLNTTEVENCLIIRKV